MLKQIIFFSLTLLMVSCTKNSSNPVTSNTAITPGVYSISTLTDNSDGNITSLYSAYTFQFTSNNAVIATNGSETVTGSWSQRPAHENEGAKLDISFSDDFFDRLDKNWEIVSVSASTISLRDDDLSSNETLVFSKQ